MKPSSALAHGLANRAKRLPFLRGVPLTELLLLAELALAARKHVRHLEVGERARLLELLRGSRRLSASERTELRELVEKLALRDFAVTAIDLVSPVPVPRRLRRWVGG